MDLKMTHDHPNFLYQLSSPDTVGLHKAGPLYQRESEQFLKDREFDNNTTLTSIIESAHKALGNRHEAAPINYSQIIASE
jgi:hypothetical protein